MTRWIDPGISGGTIFQGRYEIVALLAEGGFGAVYAARQLATGQEVAVKVLRIQGQRGAAAQKSVARFQREMWLCARLHHPNIVRLVDSGQAGEGAAYSVFELVPGRDLCAVLAGEGALEPAEARHLMLQVLDALSCAHARGVVHRDLKPGNIMVVPSGARRNALVLDFGVGALVEDSRHADYARVTATHDAIGTPSYAAPEQLKGAAPTPRADLYAWGLVFLECLTGRRVISGASLHEAIFEQLGPAEIPIPAALRDHPLGAILRKATAKDVAARDVTAQGLLRELEACALSGLRREALSAGDAASRAPAPPAHVLVRGRWKLTAVCCALSVLGVGPVPPDLEDLDDLLETQQEVCAEIARRFRGRMASALGDRVLLYFGSPVACDDDAPRAARAAVEIAAEIGKQSTRLEAERGVAIEVRVGLYTGLVAHGREEQAGEAAGHLVGTTAKVAARLSALAPAGAIVTSGETYRLLEGQFTLNAEGTHTLEPGAGPVAIYRLRGGGAG